MAIKCEWCADPNADEPDNIDDLCDDHAAEYEGITVDQLHRREKIQTAEWLDSIS